MKFNYLTIDRKGPVATLCLNRPESGNALSMKLMMEIIAACESFKYDTESRVLLFRGAGKNFCVGADLKDPERRTRADGATLHERQRMGQLGRDMIEAILGINQITIAAIQGAAAGGGACITTACDFRIGVEGCRIGYPEVKLGMNLSWGALPLCYNLIGPAASKRMVIGGELEPAEQLAQWGFLDELVAASELETALDKMSQFYISRPAMAAQMIKRSINAIQMAGKVSTMHMDGDQFTLATEGEDYSRAREEFLNRER